jgi:hypothetical protein
VKPLPAIGLAVLFVGARAGATPTPARLVYERGEGADKCPTETELKAAVAQRLGSDPFEAYGAISVHVLLRRTGSVLSADVEVHGEDGGLIGQRTITSNAASCDEIANALAVTISVALDPVRVTPPSNGPEPVAAPKPEPPKAAPPSPSPEAPRPAAEPGFRPRWEALVGGGAAVGAAPNPAAAILVGFGGRIEAFSAQIEGRACLSSGASVDQGNVSASSAWVSLVPCLHAGIVGACALGQIGVVRGRGGGVALPAEDSSFGAAAGVRVQVEASLSDAVGLRFGGDLTTTIHGTRLVLNGRDAWATPPLGGLLWTSGVLHFR